MYIHNFASPPTLIFLLLTEHPFQPPLLCYTPPVASPTPPTADPLALLASLYSSVLLVRLASLPRSQGWRLELSEDDGGTWTSLEPGQPGHASPALAIEAGSESISNWRASRVEATSAEISTYFLQGKLERKKIQVMLGEEGMVEVDGYVALANDGKTWLEDIEPNQAIRKAKEYRVKSSTGKK